MRVALFKNLNLTFLAVCLAALFGCDPNDNSTQSSANCIGSVIITVYDGALERRCGCQEGNGVFPAGSPFTCSVAVGTQLLVQFISVQQSHQIQVGSLFTTPIVTPGGPSVQTYSVGLTVVGSLPITDVFLPSMSGTLLIF